MKKIASIIIAMFMGIALAIGGGVLLAGCVQDKFPEKSSVEIGDNQPNQKIESDDATLPTKGHLLFNANGGIISSSRAYQISNISLTNYGYGFEANANGYLESQNKGVNNSYAMVAIRFYSNTSSSSFTIRYISYAESNFDYAIFGNLDQALSESYNVDSTYYKRTYGEASASEKSITYSGITSGWHNIYVKFRKDGSNHVYNDSLQLFFENDYYTAQASKGQYQGMQYGTLPTATRVGYEFSGWYRKHNSLDLNDFVNFFNSQEDAHNDGDIRYIIRDDDGVYSWAGATGGYWVNGDFIHHQYNINLANGATYKLSYYSRRDEDFPTTAIIPYGSYTIVSGSLESANSYDWKKQEMTFTVTGNINFQLSYNYHYTTYFKEIFLERIDIDDYEKVTSSTIYNDDQSLIAQWKANSYTVTFDPNGGRGVNLFSYIPQLGSSTNQLSSNDINYYTSGEDIYVSSKSNDYTDHYGHLDIWFYFNANVNYQLSFSAVSTNSSVLNSPVDAGFFLDGGYSLYYHVGGPVVNSISIPVTFIYNFTPTTSGKYQFRLDTNYNNAKFKLSNFSLTSNGGVSRRMATYNSSYGTLPTPTRAYYNFDGWHRDVYLGSDQMIETTNTHFVWLRDVGVNLQEGVRYHLSFDMRLTSGEASWEHNYLFINYRTTATLHNAGESVLRNVTTSWQKYECEFTFANNNGTYNELYDKDILHLYLIGEHNRQIKNLVILEDNKTTTPTSLVNLAYNHTLYAYWTPVSIKNSVKLRVINKDGTYSDVDNANGGSVEVHWWEIAGASSSPTGVVQTAASAPYTVHQGQQFRIVAYANSGYVFAGFSTSSTPSSAIKNPSSPPGTTANYYPTSGTNYYVYFKQMSGNVLKYDETDKYFYFEDGYYPQSRATNEGTLNSSARANGESFTYSDGKKNVSIPVYTYGSDRYVKVTKNGTSAWFKFEPIRWRISDYGIAKTERNIAKYTSLYNLRNYTSYATNFTAVSDLILGVGAMHNTREIDENLKVNGVLIGTYNKDLLGYQNIQNTTNGVTLNFNYSASTSQIDVERYGCTELGEGFTKINVFDVGKFEVYDAPLRIVSMKELEQVGFVSKQARASDMVAFILGLDKDQVSYWTRDLSNLGAGIAITPSGTEIRPWLDEVLGMRFAYTFREGINGDFYS